MELYKSKYSDKKDSRGTSKRENGPSRSFRNSSNDRSSRYSRDDRSSRYSRDDRRGESTTVTCADCGTECQVPFVPRTDKPVYCSDCFRQNKPQDSSNDGYSRDDRSSRYSRDDRSSRYSRDDRSSRYSRDDRSSRYSRDDRSSRYSRDDRSSRYSRDDRRGESTTVTCADCGTECQVPFVPRTDKPVYCSDCFRQNKPQDSSNDGYSRDDRSSRSSNRQEFTRTDSRFKKPKGDKFLKKQESFYSGGSEKFYATLKEKLFEILGGKSCSSCGFKDERALGISHIFDDSPTSLGRGGAASSWGKYISEPELAKKDLRVLCLNCNEIRQPVSKPKENSSKSKPKKSRYFPR